MDNAPWEQRLGGGDVDIELALVLRTRLAGLEFDHLDLPAGALDEAVDAATDDRAVLRSPGERDFVFSPRNRSTVAEDLGDLGLRSDARQRLVRLRK